jgi:hypothetical protein
VNFIELVKLLRVARREGRLPGLTADEYALLDERILVSSWYPIETLWRWLELCHELFGATDEAAIQMGRIGGERVLSGVHSSFIKPDDLERGLKTVERAWSSYFDFGTIQAKLVSDVIRITIHDYPDIPRVHGLCMLGWYEAAVLLNEYEQRYARIVAEPWSGAPALVLEIGITKRTQPA